NGLERLKPVSSSGYEVPIGVGVNVLGVGVPVGKGVFVGAGVLVVAGGKVGMVAGVLVIVGGIDIAVGVQVAVAVPVATPVGVGVGAPQLDNETRTSRHNSRNNQRRSIFLRLRHFLLPCDCQTTNGVSASQMPSVGSK